MCNNFIGNRRDGKAGRIGTKRAAQLRIELALVTGGLMWLALILLARLFQRVAEHVRRASLLHTKQRQHEIERKEPSVATHSDTHLNKDRQGKQQPRRRLLAKPRGARRLSRYPLAGYSLKRLVPARAQIPIC